jgi:hypothetical protein
MCGIYLLKDASVLVCGIDYEPTGPGGLSSRVVVRLSADAAGDMLGIVVLQVLDRTQVIDARNWNAKDVLPNVLAMAGVKSNRALESTAKYVHVSWRDDDIKVVPTKSRAFSNGGYEHLSRSAGTCSPTAGALRDLIVEKLGASELDG